MRKALKVAICTMALLGAAAGAALAADTVIYRQTFESGNGGFVFTGPWSWGPVTITSGETSEVIPTGCYAGAKCIGTGLADVFDGTPGEALSPAVSIPVLGTGQFAVVSYYAWTNIDMYDRGKFYISGDGGTTWYKISTHYMNETVYAPDILYSYTQNPGSTARPNEWRKFSYDISAYSGQQVIFKYTNADTDNMPGYYIDDLTVTVSTVGPVNNVTLTLEGAENPNGSCPWLYTFDGESWVRDNDIYSVARYERGEYRDFYKVEKPLLAQGGVYKVQVREIEEEISYTDNVDLWAVDHAADVTVGIDSSGNVNAYKATELLAPVSVANKVGADVSGLVSSRDDIGYGAFSEDYLDVDFGAVPTEGARNLVLRVKGFLEGEGENPAMPFIGQPAVVVKALEDGVWVEKGRLKPRFEWSENVFDLSTVAPDAQGRTKVRLAVISHDRKYHEIDFVGLFAGAEPAFTLHDLSLTGAAGTWGDALAALSAADNEYLRMETSEAFEATFSNSAATAAVRDFIFISEGYYKPANTIYIYTWDGSSWVRRDGRSFVDEAESYTDLTYSIDLSMYLPDIDGEYKVRLWNNFNQGYGPAYLDLAEMTVEPIGGDPITGTIDLAQDVRYPSDAYLSGVLENLISASDDQRYDMALQSNSFEGSSNYRADFDSTYGGSARSNWVQIRFGGLPANNPPIVANITLRRNRVTWTVEDADEGDTQMAFAAEIWTQPGGNGDIVWNPDTFEGSSGSLTLPDGLVTGETYYLRVRASDGTTWGNWTEYEFVMPALDFKLYDEKVNIGCFIDTLQR